MKILQGLAVSAEIVISLFATLVLSTVTPAIAFESKPVTFLQATDQVLPPGSILAGGLVRIVGSIGQSVQVPGCVDGDTSFFPVQKAAAVRGLGAGAGEIIIISQTEPLPRGTYLQLFTIEQCTDGTQLYDKIVAATIPDPNKK